MKRVAIVHPWFPQYRAPFFENLIKRARDFDIDIEIFHGSPPPEWGERGDSVTARYATLLPTKFFKIRGKSLALKSLEPLMCRHAYDLIIVEQAVRNLETFKMLFGPYRFKLAFWGHGRTYTEKVGRLQEAVKMSLTRRGKWFFSYTTGGAKAVESAGFAHDRITVVQNAINSEELRREVSLVSGSDLERFNSRFDLKGKTAVFVGGLDQAKRLPFLVRAADICHASLPDFRLIVLGDGSHRNIIEESAEDRAWLHYLGRSRGSEKAQALASAQLMMMPGRVGLVAVDSFAAALPIVTTDWPYHAPEFEYLVNGQNSIITDDSEESYAREVVALLSDPLRLSIMQSGSDESAGQYSLEKMVENFAIGLRDALSSL
ncbi:glycosyltransferase family 4 protein [Arthrobacter sp. SO3]|uniref:glycosyltransferase family 4 protein n=1 Tax=Arthrobacter sp. SO3 TaxID=1897057 RepID=UPI001CFFBB4D|nr:glycosyltransferase family 4 protein [Arthrobacter sp. SO3]MCB5291210.1 Glycosyltransferase Gtf1 [Arthrobacter sp. SO3]